MHAAVQSGGRSPKRLNGASVAPQKSSSDGTQNCDPSKGKKRDRAEQGNDHDRPVKVDESEPGNLKVENMKFKIAKITEKDDLTHVEAAEKLVHLMQLDRTERKIDFAGRVMAADIIAAAESPDFLVRFVQLRGLHVLDDWLQEVHDGKSGEGSSPKENDEEFIFALLCALAKLPINLNALQSCSIGRSVNHLRSYKNLEIQTKAKCLIENWKKRVDAEMKSNYVKAAVSGQGKTGFSEISTAASGNAVEMLKRVNEQGQLKDEKEDTQTEQILQRKDDKIKLQQSLLGLQREDMLKRCEIEKEKITSAREEVEVRKQQTQVEMWKAEAHFMGQDLDKLAPHLREYYITMQREILDRRGTRSPPSSDA